MDFQDPKGFMLFKLPHQSGHIGKILRDAETGRES